MTTPTIDLLGSASRAPAQRTGLPTSALVRGSASAGRPSIRELYDRWLTPPSRPRPPRRGRRSLVILVQTLVVFACAQVAVAVFLVAQGPAGRDPIYQARLARLQQRQREQPGRPVVLVLGSSRLLNGLDEDLAIKESESQGRPVWVANFACPGAGPRNQRFFLERLVRAGIQPDLVVVEALPSLLFAKQVAVDLNEARLPTRRLAREDLALVQRYAAATRPHVTVDWIAHWLVPLYGYRFALVNQAAPPLLPLWLRQEFMADAWDFSAIHAPYQVAHPPQRDKALARAQREHGELVEHFRQDEPGCEVLFDLLAQCQRHGFRTAVVFMPEGPVFQSWYTPESRRQLDAFLPNVARQGNTVVINARDWLPDENYFADSHHLLAHGGEAFTRRFWRDGLRPLLQK